MSETGGAVFLSYASEDAAAAARICEGLHAAGIEVWFDQSELRGGDAWDHHIRSQIRDCALFVPIISTHTQSRPEGYFRLEWDLADQRSHMIVRSKAFIVPVGVDRTPDGGAEVPETFLKVQWTRLPDGVTTPAFCERIANCSRAARPVKRPQKSLPPSDRRAAEDILPAPRRCDRGGGAGRGRAWWAAVASVARCRGEAFGGSSGSGRRRGCRRARQIDRGATVCGHEREARSGVFFRRSFGGID